MRLTFLGRVAALLALIGAGLGAPTAPTAIRELTEDDFPAALLATTTLALTGVSLWVLILVAIGHSPRCSAVLRATTPAFLTRALFIGALGATVATPSVADQGSPVSVDGLALPDRPVVTSTHPEPVTHPHVVATGDTLWAIAADRLPSSASDADIALATARWHAANHDVIGADPDLIRPGQHLTPPSETSS